MHFMSKLNLKLNSLSNCKHTHKAREYFNHKLKQWTCTLSRSNNNIVDRDEDQLDEETYESHDNESDRRTERNLREFCEISK